ncbi:MAG TPA: MlaD family protein [Kofleriaceae bacterium]|nr:MlaD family protein [Kofleriaceae bacterium]
MTSTKRATHLKLGIFALVVIGALIAMILMLGARHFRKETVTYVTYFDESVQGLERGAPVKFRGVSIGSVDSISVARDGRYVLVKLDLDRQAEKRLRASSDLSLLRAQLATQGITGVRLVDITIVDPIEHPAPKLTFAPGPNYIPSRPSLVRGLETGVEEIQRRLPELADQFESVMRKVERSLDHLEEEGIIRKLGEAITDARATARSLRAFTRDVQRENLPKRTSEVLASIDAAVAKARRSFEAAGHATTSSSSELRATLRDLSDAARAVRELANEIERAPDMLVKGRSRRRE